jgi:glycosyltransferase involved in cell wall biosynthesis
MEWRINLEAGEMSDATSVVADAGNCIGSFVRVASHRTRVAVVSDLREENWFSMNLVADMLVEGLRRDHSEGISVERVCPPMRRRLTRGDVSNGVRFNADRLINRFHDYPRALRRMRDDFDLFHIVDHSYSQLVHQLPPERTVVTCHDLDTFRCLLAPASEPRPTLFRAMTRRVLSGFRKAARVACDSAATRDELLKHELIAPERVVVIPNGVHPAFRVAPNAQDDREAARLLGEPDEHAIDILHVGSTIARKRIDVLLRAFAAVREQFPRARLIRVGGEFNAAQETLVEKLNLRDALVVLPYLTTGVLAAVYRRAALVVQPSEREGFGLPLVEALACGTHVVASDLPVHREVGGEAATYRAVGDASALAEACVELLHERASDAGRWASRRAAGIAQSSRWRWQAYVAKTVALYGEVLESCE